ncbi:hypothetical protein A3L08_02980 [Thermococcus pacificus]|uniref:Protein-glutamine gamma-glutamyltransferase-like C-terminal domain-containing protein n=2 Tax=Thermococcus pacificus TaxID=71998 RepID=A0A218PA10_9EURY|nr:hypothetical protein A3L08_02980 [Thermococcus pacificus]
MRKVSILIILILIIGSVPLASGKAVQEPTQRDVFLYQYFSQVLVRFDYSLRYALVNENYSLKLANLTLSELELIKDESLYYQEKGVNSTVMRVIPPFYDFASEMVVLVQLVLEFHENPTPALASGILSTVDDMERTLDVIEGIRLMNGTEVLTFNTAKVRTHLAAIRKLVSNLPPGQGDFVIGVSDDSPILHQTITIFGSCPGNSSVTVVIEGGNSTSLLLVNSRNGLFSTNYRFDELGTYRIYAVQGGERSNNVTVTVRRIPTSFIVDDSYSAFLNSTVHLSGRLVDYYGNPLGGRKITVGNSTLTTGSDGGFSKGYFSPVATSFKVTLRFGGDATHAATMKEVIVRFTRYPVSITLDGPSEVVLGKTAVFTGTVDPALPFPITVYVAGKEYLRLTPDNGTFSFELKPNETGEFEVYASFSGNERYEKAKSNVVVLKVVPPENMMLRYIAIALLALLMVALILLERRKEGDKAPARKKPEPDVVPGEEKVPIKAETEFKIPEDVGEAYTLLRERLREALGVSESMTPREVLRALRDWELYPYLETVTKLHEKAVYGEMPLSEGETAEFVNAMENLLRGVSG